MNEKKKKVLIGMSGGVDSSVAAALLIEQGYDCIGVYMNLWADPTPFDLEDKEKFPQNKCCSIESLMFARSICQQLGIPFYSVNFEQEFRGKVVDFFLEGFKEGETPNPCVRCNKTIKFGAFFKKMEELGCDYLATGHYAKILEDEKGVRSIHRGVDESKDQTYFLYNLTQDKLQKLLFPLGDYDKDEVKELAKKFNLKKLENKKESQGVCFYPEKTYFGFLRRYLKKDEDYEAGKIMNKEGEVLGEHEGLPFYTIGQRKGMGIGGPGGPHFVNKVDSINNALIIGNESDLFSDYVIVRDLNFLSGEWPEDGAEFEVKIRSHGKMGRAQIQRLESDTSKNSDKLKVQFLEPQRAVMAGQSLVFYKDGELIGGGIMEFS